MKADHIVSRVTHWLRFGICVAILLMIAVALLQAFGVRLPIRGLGHVELAYLAGAYWLVK